jgi:hypothetical protein
VGYFSGATFFKIVGAGSVSTVVADPTDPAGQRQVILYAPEAPEILFQDYGQGRLHNGRAHVDIDPIFAGNVLIDDEHPLRVFIQLEDDENVRGVIVKNKSGEGFDVVELDGGKSNAPFSWTITANRADEVLPSGRLSRNADARFQVMAPPEKTLSKGVRGMKGSTAVGAPDPETGATSQPTPQPTSHGSQDLSWLLPLIRSR